MLELAVRQYWVLGLGAGDSEGAERFGHELINRANVGLTVRIYGPDALSVSYLISAREASIPGDGDRHQWVQTVTFAYTFLGDTRFGAVEWRPAEMSDR
jgi:hypothetical protein